MLAARRHCSRRAARRARCAAETPRCRRGGPAASALAVRLPPTPLHDPARLSAHRLPRRRALHRRLLARRAGAPLRHAAVRLLERGDARRARRLPARAGRARPPRLLRDEGQLEPGGAADLRAGGLRLRHRLGRRARARAGRGRPAAKVVFSGVGKTRAEMRRALDAGVLCFNVESEAELECCRRSHRKRAPARGEPARQPRRRRRHASVHLDRPEGQQVRHRARARAGRLSARAALPGLEWSASIATSARRSPTPAPTSTRSTACSIWSRRSKRAASRSTTSISAAAWASPTPTNAARCRRAGREPARAHRRARPRPPQDHVRAGPLAGRQRRRARQRSALPEARRAEELLHRRRGDERPDAPGDVRRLDEHRRLPAP